MNPPSTKPAITGTVAAAPKAPYTAARDAKDRSVNGTAADGSILALDRRLTEGLNLLHGRLDVLHEDVRENRRDIKQLRQDVWDGLKEAAGERGRLATDLAGLRESQNQFRAEVAARFAALEESQNQLRAEMNVRFAALEESQNQLRAEMNVRFAALEESQNQLRAEMNVRFAALEESNRQIIAIVSRIQERSEAAAWTRRRVLAAVAAGISLLVIGALLQPLLEQAAAALLGG